MMWPARALSSAYPATRSAVAVHCRYQLSRSPSSIREVVVEISPSGHLSMISGRSANSSKRGSSKKIFLVTSPLISLRCGCEDRRDEVSHNPRRLLSLPLPRRVVAPQNYIVEPSEAQRMSQMHYFCLLNERCLYLEPVNSLPLFFLDLFTEMPRGGLLGNSPP